MKKQKIKLFLTTVLTLCLTLSVSINTYSVMASSDNSISVRGPVFEASGIVSWFDGVGEEGSDGKILGVMDCATNWI